VAVTGAGTHPVRPQDFYPNGRERVLRPRLAAAAARGVAPVGEKEEYIARAWRNITPYLPARSVSLACGRG
jgi:hypothetical protein